jgi:prevent-host-death family protein
MPIVGLRELSRETRQVIEQLEKDGEPVVVTRHGKAVAALTPVSDRQAAALALALVPEFTSIRDDAKQAIAAREGKPASQLLAELEAEDAAQETAGEAVVVEAVLVDQHLIRAVDEPEPVAIPNSLTRQIAIRLARSIIGVPRSPSIETLSTDLADVFVRDSLSSAVERVRRVNENIIAEVRGEGGELSEATYASELKRVTEAERLTSRSPLA